MVKVIHMRVLTLLIAALSIPDFIEQLEILRTDSNQNKCKKSLFSKLPIKSGGITDLSKYSD